MNGDASDGDVADPESLFSGYSGRVFLAIAVGWLGFGSDGASSRRFYRR